MVLAEWNNHVFEVSPVKIHSFKDMKITGSVETNKVTVNNTKGQAVSVKNGKPRKVVLTAMLSQACGCTDIQDECLDYVQEASKGEEGYLYCGGEKLFTCMMMLTQAVVSQVEMKSDGTWSYAQVELTLEQSTKLDGQRKKSSGTKNPIVDSYETTKVSGVASKIAKQNVTTTSTTTKPSTTTSTKDKILLLLN